MAGGNQLAYAFLFLLAIILIVSGFQGSFGRVLAVCFVPGDLIVGDPVNTTGGCPPGQIMWFGVCQPDPWGFSNLTSSTGAITV